MTEEIPVNCINLMHRELRREQAENEAKEQGFYIKFWEGIIDRHMRRRGVNLAHKQIIRQAKENGDRLCCIMEDDCRFFAKGAWDYYLERIPEDFDLYLAMCYYCDLDESNRIMGLFSSLTLYIVHERFYDFYLSVPEDEHLDRYLGLTSDTHKYIVCDKYCCEQDGSISDNSLMQSDYKSYLIGRNIYGKD